MRFNAAFVERCDDSRPQPCPDCSHARPRDWQGTRRTRQGPIRPRRVEAVSEETASAEPSSPAPRTAPRPGVVRSPSAIIKKIHSLRHALRTRSSSDDAERTELRAERGRSAASASRNQADAAREARWLGCGNLTLGASLGFAIMMTRQSLLNVSRRYAPYLTGEDPAVDVACPHTALKDALRMLLE